jgi:hypothetical protein
MKTNVGNVTPCNLSFDRILLSRGFRVQNETLVHMKRWYHSARLHGVTSEKTVIVRLSVVFWVVTPCILVSTFKKIYAASIVRDSLA